MQHFYRGLRVSEHQTREGHYKCSTALFLEPQNSFTHHWNHRTQQHASQTEALNKYCLTYYKPRKIRNTVILWR